MSVQQCAHRRDRRGYSRSAVARRRALAKRRWWYTSRVYGRYTIFKGKAALDFGPIAPTFKAAGVDAAVERPGVLLLGFTHPGRPILRVGTNSQLRCPPLSAGAPVVCDPGHGRQREGVLLSRPRYGPGCRGAEQQALGGINASRR